MIGSIYVTGTNCEKYPHRDCQIQLIREPAELNSVLMVKFFGVNPQSYHDHTISCLESVQYSTMPSPLEYQQQLLEQGERLLEMAIQFEEEDEELDGVLPAILEAVALQHDDENEASTWGGSCKGKASYLLV